MIAQKTGGFGEFFVSLDGLRDRRCRHRIGGGGGNGDAAGCCVGGGAGKGSTAAPCGGVPAAGWGAALLAAVLVLATDLCGFGFRAGLRGGGTAWSAATTGLGANVGGGLSQKECSGGWPAVTCTVCGTKPIFANVTAWLSDGTARAQGV